MSCAITSVVPRRDQVCGLCEEPFDGGVEAVNHNRPVGSRAIVHDPMHFECLTNWRDQTNVRGKFCCPIEGVQLSEPPLFGPILRARPESSGGALLFDTFSNFTGIARTALIATVLQLPMTLGSVAVIAFMNQGLHPYSSASNYLSVLVAPILLGSQATFVLCSKISRYLKLKETTRKVILLGGLAGGMCLASLLSDQYEMAPRMFCTLLPFCTALTTGVCDLARKFFYKSRA